MLNWSEEIHTFLCLTHFIFLKHFGDRTQANYGTPILLVRIGKEGVTRQTSATVIMHAYTCTNYTNAGMQNTVIKSSHKLVYCMHNRQTNTHMQTHAGSQCIFTVYCCNIIYN